MRSILIAASCSNTAVASLRPLAVLGGILRMEIDAAAWADTYQRRIGYDWSAQLSSRTLGDVRASVDQRAICRRTG